MTHLARTIPAVVLFALIAEPAPSAELPEMRLFGIANIEQVTQPPSSPSVFSFSSAHPWRMTLISTYHWNSGFGDTPGTIWLTEGGGSNFGPWQTVGRNGMGGVPNAYWDAATNVMLPQGTETVTVRIPRSAFPNGLFARLRCEPQP